MDNTVRIHHMFFTHSSSNGHLGSPCILAISSSAAMKTGIIIPLQDPDEYLDKRLRDPMIILFLIFGETYILLSIVAALFCIPTIMCKNSHFSTFSPLAVFDNSPNRHVVLSPYGFDLHFPYDK
jgi:hypothetical protein